MTNTRHLHPDAELAATFEEQRERLLPCVHCGFCLPVCPTYRRLGDEADSPRGRLHLMRAVVDGRLAVTSDAFRTHIDRCLGCRACEPVCPSGVEYGSLLELARAATNRQAPPGLLTRGLLAVMGSRALRALAFAGARVLRGSGVAALGARWAPRAPALHALRFGLAMLASTRRWRPRDGARSAGLSGAGGERQARAAGATSPRGVRVGVLVGCVQDGLFSRVNEATVRVLLANGYEVVVVRGQECCGALHAHAGALERARALARINVGAFEAAAVDRVAVNAAGCGAAMKDYGALLAHDPELGERARAFSAKVRDVTELLAEVGPRPGAPVSCSVAYDHPCHLLHAQRVREAPLRVLAAIPELRVEVIEDADECCGGAGIYGITHPDLGSWIGGDKVASIRRAGCQVVATPNAGCMMQIGAGLRLENAPEEVVHPIELLDESYRRAGLYDS